MKDITQKIDYQRKTLTIISPKSKDDGYNLLLISEILKKAYSSQNYFEYYENDNNLVCLIHVLNGNEIETLEKIKAELE